MANALTQGVAVATGLQDSFDWGGVALAAVSGPLAKYAGDKVGGYLAAHDVSGTAATLIQSTAQGLTSAAVQAAVRGRVDTAQVLADVFMNFIGNDLIDKISPPEPLEEVVVTAKPWASRYGGSGSDASSSDPLAQSIAEQLHQDVEQSLTNNPLPIPDLMLPDIGPIGLPAPAADPLTEFHVTAGPRTPVPSADDPALEEVVVTGKKWTDTQKWQYDQLIQIGYTSAHAIEKVLHHPREVAFETSSTFGVGALGRLWGHFDAGVPKFLRDPSPSNAINGAGVSLVRSAEQMVEGVGRSQLLVNAGQAEAVWQQGTADFLRQSAADFNMPMLGYRSPAAEGFGAIFDTATLVGGAAGLLKSGLGGLARLGEAETLTVDSAQTLHADVSAMSRRAYLDAKFGRTGDLNADINFRGLVDRASALGFDTGFGQATFYSGFGNDLLASDFAVRTGNLTIEMTPGGRYLANEALYSRFGVDLATRVWDAASYEFASQAVGPVSVFTLGARSTGTFARIEFPALMSNARVTSLLVNGEKPLWTYANGSH